jgi:hypothetical protein
MFFRHYFDIMFEIIEAYPYPAALLKQVLRCAPTSWLRGMRSLLPVHIPPGERSFLTKEFR